MRAARNPKQTKILEFGPAQADAMQGAPGPAPEGGEENRRRIALATLRGFARVPTHAVGILNDRRSCPRAALGLPLRLTRVASQSESCPVTLVTKNISSSGVFFLCPRRIEPGTPIELEVALVERPLGRGSVRMTTAAHIVRVEPADTTGWHGMAATFDDFAFQRDEPSPPRFRAP